MDSSSNDVSVTQSADRFKIFHFFIDNSVAVVPATWIFEEDKIMKCRFPGYHTAKLKKTVKRCMEFQPEWPLYDGRILHSYDDYKVAVENLSKSQYHSEWSDADGKKKKEQTVVAPTLPEYPGTSAPATIGASTPYTFEVDPMVGESVFQLVTTASPNTGNTFDLPTSATGFYTDQSSFTRFQEDVLLQLKAIQDVQVAHSNLLQNIFRMLEDKGQKEEATYKFPRDQFPVKTANDLDQLDKLICNSQAAYTSLKVLFTSRGGGNAEDAVKLTLKFLMTDELQDAHSYRGQSEKKGFCSYNAIIQCVLDSLKDNMHTRANATMMVLDTAMSKALKQASDRVNQRRIRRANAASKSAE